MIPAGAAGRIGAVGRGRLTGHQSYMVTTMIKKPMTQTATATKDAGTQ